VRRPRGHALSATFAHRSIVSTSRALAVERTAARIKGVVLLAEPAKLLIAIFIVARDECLKLKREFCQPVG
jgi:hypothetical protein